LVPDSISRTLFHVTDYLYQGCHAIRPETLKPAHSIDVSLRAQMFDGLANRLIMELPLS
jgi:hypothetical protein